MGNSLYEHCLRFSQDWYGTEFITGFAVMIQHDAHLSTPNYKNADRVMMVFYMYPKRQVMEILPYDNAMHFVSVVFHKQHYAVLYYNIANHSVTVFDGLNMDIQKWQDHVIHTVKTYGLQSPNASVDCEFWEEVEVDKHGRKKRTDMVLEISFDDLNHKQPWHVKNDQSYVQGDDVSCGPIASLKLMEIYGSIEEGSIARIGESSHGYWPLVMDYFNDCVRRYDNDLKVKVRTNQFNTN